MPKMIVHDGGEYRVVVLAGEHFIMVFFRPVFQRPVLLVTATALVTAVDKARNRFEPETML